ncbi:unnamed protein product, partial [Discosporangium mesarthrocarpum]
MVAQEEDSTIVIDVGSASAKAGFSGEDMPRAVFPAIADDLDLSTEERSTYRARRPEDLPCVGKQNLISTAIPQSRECYRAYQDGGGDEDSAASDSTAVHPVERGLLQDIEEMEKLMDNIFNFELAVYPDAHVPVLLTEPPLNDRKHRQNLADMMFETFKVPAMCPCNSAVLALFASGRTRGLTLEVGAGVAHAVPVFEGFALSHAVIRMEGAGQDVTHQMKLMLQERGHNVEYDTVRDIKEKLCYVPFRGMEGVHHGEDEYELPDGTTITLDTACRSKPAELLFSPMAGGEAFVSHAGEDGMANMVMQSIGMCDM